MQQYIWIVDDLTQDEKPIAVAFLSFEAALAYVSKHVGDRPEYALTTCPESRVYEDNTVAYATYDDGRGWQSVSIRRLEVVNEG